LGGLFGGLFDWTADGLVAAAVDECGVPLRQPGGAHERVA
jgi:hypothetical protein